MTEDFDINVHAIMECAKNLSKEELLSLMSKTPRDRRIAQILYIKGYIDCGENLTKDMGKRKQGWPLYE